MAHREDLPFEYYPRRLNEAEMSNPYFLLQSFSTTISFLIAERHYAIGFMRGYRNQLYKIISALPTYSASMSRSKN
ncbi:MAG TPA: hypothetical protein VNI52_13075 [Sphingobacteriaceae bacterium]|nr:hypothetical protein [Sphingobacteriaceae bacterium]